MSRIRFDQLAKQYLEGFLEPLGTVQRNLEIPGESKFVDLWFTPTISASTPTIDFGLLNQIVATPCLLEPFSSSPTRQDVRTCLLKLLWLQEDHRRKTKRQKESQLEQTLPKLWILATTTSQPVIRAFGGTIQTDWGMGIYHFPEAYRGAIVAIDQLPLTPDTLWLRLLGRNQVQQQAIAELLALPQSDQRRSRVLQLLTNWRVTLELSDLDLSNDEERTLMATLSQAYLEWEQARIEQGIQQGVARGIQQGIEQGIQQGIQQGLERERALILRLLVRRLGPLPDRMLLPINQLSVTQLESLGESVLDFTTTIDLMRWLLTCRLGDLSEQALSRVSQLAPVQLEDLGEALLGFSDAVHLEHWLDENPPNVADRQTI